MKIKKGSMDHNEKEGKSSQLEMVIIHQPALATLLAEPFVCSQMQSQIKFYLAYLQDLIPTWIV